MLFQNRSHHSAQQAMHETETEMVSAQKKLTLRNPIFRGKTSRFTGFFHSRKWLRILQRISHVNRRTFSFFFPKPLGSRMTLTIKVPGRRHTVGPYYKNPLKDEVDLIILLHATVCKILSTQESGIDVAPRTFCKNIKCSL